MPAPGKCSSGLSPVWFLISVRDGIKEVCPLRGYGSSSPDTQTAFQKRGCCTQACGSDVWDDVLTSWPATSLPPVKGCLLAPCQRVSLPRRRLVPIPCSCTHSRGMMFSSLSCQGGQSEPPQLQAFFTRSFPGALAAGSCCPQFTAAVSGSGERFLGMGSAD